MWSFRRLEVSVSSTQTILTFFSNVHHTYTRIDYFLLDNRLLPRVKSCSHTSITISDHGAIVFELDLPNRPLPNRIWRLNPLLLSDEKCTDYISDQIQLFLDTNSTPGISQATLWETLKVYLRGQIIAYSSRAKKEKNFKLIDLSQQIQDNDEKHAVTYTWPIQRSAKSTDWI